MGASKGLGTPKTPDHWNPGQENQMQLKAVQAFGGGNRVALWSWLDSWGRGEALQDPAPLAMREQESQAENFLHARGKACYDQARPKYFLYADF